MNEAKLIECISRLCDIISDIAYEQSATDRSWDSWFKDTELEIEDIKRIINTLPK